MDKQHVKLVTSRFGAITATVTSKLYNNASYVDHVFGPGDKTVKIYTAEFFHRSTWFAACGETVPDSVDRLKKSIDDDASYQFELSRNAK